MGRIKEESVLSKISRWNSTEMKLLGGLVAIIGGTYLFPALYAFLNGENPFIFLTPAVPMMIFGTIVYLLFAPSINFRTVNGLITVALAWIVMFVCGSFPYIMLNFPLIDAAFESVNGFTTTGCSTIDDVYAYPVSILIWRSLTQWLGGIAVVIIFMYILPMFGMGRSFFSNELEGSGNNRFSMKLRSAAKSFILVYVLLSFLNFIILMLLNVPLVDSICLSLTTISTGGSIVSNNSMMDFSLAVQIVTMFFMFIGAVNFYLHFKAIYGKNLKEYYHNKEIKLLLGWYLFAALVIFVLYAFPIFNTGSVPPSEYGETFKNSLFMAISLGTTTGAFVIDTTAAPEIIMFLFIVLMMIGGSAGSTAGGIKITRVRLILKFFHNNLKNILHPNAVYTVKVDGEDVDDSRVLSAVSIMLLYLGTTFVAIIFLLPNWGWEESLGMAVGSITNTGIGFGTIGEAGTYSFIDPVTKGFLMLLMWIGRLEISLALVFLTPTFWHELRMNMRYSNFFKKSQ